MIVIIKKKKVSNHTFLTFIPKVPNPVELRGFRPIILVGCANKLLAKIIANKLKIILPSIIGLT